MKLALHLSLHHLAKLFALLKLVTIKIKIHCYINLWILLELSGGISTFLN